MATTTITADGGGTEHNSLYRNNTFNLGGHNWVSAIEGVGTRYRTVTRIKDADLPLSESVSDFRYGFYRWAHAWSSNATNMAVNRILDVNTWVEGVKAYAHGTAPESCWRYREIGSPNVDWPGSGASGGCVGRGTDYDATGELLFAVTAYTSGPNLLHEWALTPQWAQDWNDGTRVNNGIVIGNQLNVNNRGIIYSQEGGVVDFPYYYMEYVEAAPPPAGDVVGPNASRFRPLLSRKIK